MKVALFDSDTAWQHMQCAPRQPKRESANVYPSGVQPDDVSRSALLSALKDEKWAAAFFAFEIMRRSRSFIGAEVYPSMRHAWQVSLRMYFLKSVEQYFRQLGDLYV